MLGPALVAVAVRGPASPAAASRASENDTRALEAFFLLGEAAFHRVVMPGGGLS